MIGYILLGTNNLEKAAAFYDSLLEIFNAQRALGTERIVTWSTKQGIMLGVCTPANGSPASYGNGTMIALAAPDRETVDALYNKALALGATSHSAPIESADTEGFYGAYIRDLDQNKICFFHISSPAE